MQNYYREMQNEYKEMKYEAIQNDLKEMQNYFKECSMITETSLTYLEDVKWLGMIQNHLIFWWSANNPVSVSFLFWSELNVIIKEKTHIKCVLVVMLKEEIFFIPTAAASLGDKQSHVLEDNLYCLYFQPTDTNNPAEKHKLSSVLLIHLHHISAILWSNQQRHEHKDKCASI